jgi:hypothetical protein
MLNGKCAIDPAANRSQRVRDKAPPVVQAEALMPPSWRNQARGIFTTELRLTVTFQTSLSANGVDQRQSRRLKCLSHFRE